MLPSAIPAQLAAHYNGPFCVLTRWKALLGLSNLGCYQAEITEPDQILFFVVQGLYPIIYLRDFKIYWLMIEASKAAIGLPILDQFILVPE